MSSNASEESESFRAAPTAISAAAPTATTVPIPVVPITSIHISAASTSTAPAVPPPISLPPAPARYMGTARPKTHRPANKTYRPQRPIITHRPWVLPKYQQPKLPRRLPKGPIPRSHPRQEIALTTKQVNGKQVIPGESNTTGRKSALALTQQGEVRKLRRRKYRSPRFITWADELWAEAPTVEFFSNEEKLRVRAVERAAVAILREIRVLVKED